MAASEAVMAGVAPAVPFRPGWVNRLIDRVRRVPGPSWLVYLAAWVVVLALQTGINWYSGTYAPGTLFGFHAAGAARLRERLISPSTRARMAALPSASSG